MTGIMAAYRYRCMRCGTEKTVWRLARLRDRKRLSLSCACCGEVTRHEKIGARE